MPFMPRFWRRRGEIRSARTCSSSRGACAPTATCTAVSLCRATAVAATHLPVAAAYLSMAAMHLSKAAAYLPCVDSVAHITIACVTLRLQTAGHHPAQCCCLTQL